MFQLKKIPNTITFDGNELENHAKEIVKDKVLMETLDEVANRFLLKGGYTVTKRKSKMPGMGIHDYGSFGPYWWPDPDKPDGLPYIRRDGEVNPVTEEEHSFKELFDSILALTLAGYYLEKEEYLCGAIRNIRMWYIDEETYMTPNLKFGQGIPGITTGRSFGLIETRYCFDLFDSLAILDAIGYLDSDTDTKMKKWFEDFTNWMLTDELGVDENRRLNNHGVWYDVQIMAQSAYLKRELLGRLFEERFSKIRLLTQIAEDGAQPEELARTNALSYSIMNLEGMLIFGKIAKQCGLTKGVFDVTNSKGEELLRLAGQFLIPYFDDFSKFPYSQIAGNVSIESKAKVMTFLEKEYPGYGFGEYAKKIINSKMLFRLLPR